MDFGHDRTLGSPDGEGLLYWLEVDLNRIERNVRTLVKLLNGVPLLVVVKSDGYGHGMLPVARRALAAGARFLGVAGVEEGRALRRDGVLAPVLLLQPLLPGEAPAAVAENLRVTVCDWETAVAVAQAARRNGRQAIVHVKVDTGMGRFGVSVDRAVDLLRSILRLQDVHIEGVYSHLSCADIPGHPHTDYQIAAFRALKEECQREFPGHRWLFHLCNSAGMLAYPHARFDMCRVGVAAYGIVPEGGAAGFGPFAGVSLEPAMTLHARVVAVRDVPAGTPIGYGCTYRARQDTRIAVLSIGYGTGLPRGLSNVGRVLIRGQAYPIVGRVCMNQTMVDVGHNAPVEPGDDAVLLGRQGGQTITVEEWCHHLDTIPHDVLCQVGRTRPRLYRASP